MAATEYCEYWARGRGGGGGGGGGYTRAALGIHYSSITC